MDEHDVVALRQEALLLVEQDQCAVVPRTCWQCNEAHEHLRNDAEIVVYCVMECGRYFYKGVDITDYSADADDV